MVYDLYSAENELLVVVEVKFVEGCGRVFPALCTAGARRNLKTATRLREKLRLQAKKACAERCLLYTVFSQRAPPVLSQSGHRTVSCESQCGVETDWLKYSMIQQTVVRQNARQGFQVDMEANFGFVGNSRRTQTSFFGCSYSTVQYFLLFY